MPPTLTGTLLGGKLTADQKIQRARENLMVSHPFYGGILVRMQMVELRPDHPIRTMATDGEFIYWQRAFVDDKTTRQVEFILAHEVGHVIYMHHLRRGDRDPGIWNEAGDYIINGILVNEGKLEFPGDGLLDPRFDDNNTEQAFDVLYREVLERQKQSQGGEGEGKSGENAAKSGPSDGSQGSEGQDTGQDEDAPEDASEGQEEGTGKNADSKNADAPSGAGTNNPHVPDGYEDVVGGVIDLTKENGEELDEVERREAERDMQEQVQLSLAAARAEGREFSEAERLVKEAIIPKQDPAELLKEFISRTACGDPTWSKQNRRHLWRGLYLPGYEPGEVKSLVIAIDTSGSTASVVDLMERFRGWVNAIITDGVTKIGEITVIYCAERVRKVDTFAIGDEVEFNAPMGGGTRFSPVFDKVEELGLDPDALIYFTDLMCSDFGEEPNYPVLWAVYQPREYRMETVPFGRAIAIE